MSERAENPTFYRLVAICVGVIIFGALSLTAAAILENVRFSRAINNLLFLVVKTRQIATAQPTFAIVPGVNITDSLVSAQQVPADIAETPWGDNSTLFSLNNSMMRYEADLPTRDCRRVSLYLLTQHPTNLGLLAIDAQPRPVRATQTTQAWIRIYPESDATKLRSVDMIKSACGIGKTARLGLVFRLR